MKVYFDGGLKQAAKKAGYSDGVLNSIVGCRKFKRTHKFIPKACESILRIFQSQFIANNVEGKTVAEQIITTLTTHSKNQVSDIASIFKLITHLCQDKGKVTSGLRKYLCDLSSGDDNCKLWSKFVLEDCLP